MTLLNELRAANMGKAFGPALLSLSLFLPLLAAAPAQSQSNDLRSILDRLQRMERDIRTLNIQVSQGAAAAPGSATVLPQSGGDGGAAAARLAVRLTALEDDLRATTGTVEDVANQVHRIGQRLDKLVADLDYRLSAIEEYAARVQAQTPRVNAAPSPAGVQKALPGANQPGVLGVIPQGDLDAAGNAGTDQVATAALPAKPEPGVLPQGTVKDRYAFAFNLLKKARYDQAEVALKEFIAAHPDDPLAGNANYWLAESYYVRTQYAQAVEAFFTGYQSAPTGPKAPDMLLKLGMSLSNLDKTQEACASFGKLVEDFPEAPARILSKAAFESKKIGCE